MINYFVSIKTKENFFERFEVPKEVYIYIKLLETAIRHPKASSLKEVYNEIFK